MTEVLSATLKDDSVPETFSLRHTNSAGVPFPSLYLKIVPISYVDHIRISLNTNVLSYRGVIAHIAIAFIYPFGSSPFLDSAEKAT